MDREDDLQTPPSPNRVSRSFSLRPEVLKIVQDLATEENNTPSRILEKAVLAYEASRHPGRPS